MEFFKSDRPRFRPGTTITGRQSKPVCDLGVELVGHGRVYVDEMEYKLIGRALGKPSEQQYQRAVAERDEAVARAAELEAKVARLQPVYDAVVGVAETLEPAPSTQRTTENAHVTAAEDDFAEAVTIDEFSPAAALAGPPACSATKKSGDPCTAAPLPGRDVCLAHSKQQVPA